MNVETHGFFSSILKTDAISTDFLRHSKIYIQNLNMCFFLFCFALICWLNALSPCLFYCIAYNCRTMELKHTFRISHFIYVYAIDSISITFSYFLLWFNLLYFTLLYMNIIYINIYLYNISNGFHNCFA